MESDSTLQPKNIPHWLALVAICACVLLAFGSSIRHGFVWDDEGLIVQNSAQLTSDGPGDFFIRGFWALGENFQDATRSFYRPLVMATYMADYGMWGLNPLGFHLANIAWHLLASLLAYGVALRLLGGRVAALMAALVFAVHPTHVENVCWIAGRTDIICAVFFMLGFLALPRQDTGFRGVAGPFAAAAAFGLALLSKETAIVFPVVAALYLAKPRGSAGAGSPDLDASRGGGYKSLLWILLGLVTAWYLAMRWVVLGELFGHASFGTPAERLVTIPVMLMRYIEGLFMFQPLDPHHPDGFVGVRDAWQAWVGLVLAACLGWMLLRAWRNGRTGIACALGWMLLTLLPAFRLGAFGDILRADRFLYLPSVGFSILLATAVVWMARKVGAVDPARAKAAAAGAAVAITVLLAGWIAYANAYSAVWRDNLSLFSHAVRTSFKSAYVLYNLGNSLATAGRHEEAASAYTRAVTYEPDFVEAVANRGISLARLGRHDEAIASYMKALSGGDHSSILLSNLAASHRKMGRLDEACKWYGLSIAIDATVEALNNYGECLLAMGDAVGAEASFSRAMNVADSPEILNNLALLAIGRKDYQTAVKCLDRMAAAPGERSDESELAWNYNMARCMSELRGAAEAKPYAEKALRIAEESGNHAGYLRDELLTRLAGRVD